MSRIQLALRVSDLEGSVAFYRSLFGVGPAKRRPGYANFAITEPPLKLVLIEGAAGRPTVMDHLGVEVETTDEVHAATGRLTDLGLLTSVENDTTCCYALQDKVWVHGPGTEPWEVYTVKADAPDATGHPPGSRLLDRGGRRLPVRHPHARGRRQAVEGRRRSSVLHPGHARLSPVIGTARATPARTTSALRKTCER